MASYTAKATASSKTSATTLATSSLAFSPGAMQIVALGYDDAATGVHPVATWGNRILANRPASATRNPGTYDIAMSVHVLPRVKRSTSHVITGTWQSAIVEKALACGEIIGKNRIDLAAGNNDTVATANPVTGTTGTLSFADDFAMAFFVSEGPTADTAGTMQILDGGTWTNVTGTQRIGTAGAPPVSNVTLQVGWLQLTSSQATQGRIQTATSRLWASAIVTFKDALDNLQAISPSNMADAEVIFEDHSPSIDPENIAYVYNHVTDEWEGFDKNDMATRICYRPAGTEWTAG